MLKSADEEDKELMKIAMLGSPLFLLGFSGKLDIVFNEYEEILEHPMLSKFMLSFSQVFEKLFEQKPDALAKKRLDRGQIKLDENSYDYESMKNLVALIDLVNDAFDSFNSLDYETFDNINIKILNMNLPISAEINLNSKGLGNAIHLGANALISKGAGGLARKVELTQD